VNFTRECLCNIGDIKLIKEICGNRTRLRIKFVEEKVHRFRNPSPQKWYHQPGRDGSRKKEK
jgi:hypothetical protein